MVIYIHKRHPPKSGYPQTQGGEGVGQSRLGTELAQQKACQHLGMELARQGGVLKLGGTFIAR